MEKLLILMLGIIIGMGIFWLWWKISKIKENERIAEIFDDMEKEMSKERGAKVVISEEVRELAELRARADAYKEWNEENEK